MKIRTVTTRSVDNEDRMAIAHHYHADGLAPYQMCKQFFNEGNDLVAARLKFFSHQSEKYAKLAGE